MPANSRWDLIRRLRVNSLPPAGVCTHHIISYFQLETGCSEYVLFLSREKSLLLTGAAFEVNDKSLSSSCSALSVLGRKASIKVCLQS